MAGLFGAAVLASVVFVDPQTMSGSEITTMRVVVNVGLQLDDAKFGFSWRNRGGRVSGGGSSI